ncbi:phosphoadenosine phosphosulfate reductase family protein [Paucidesulfovibrio longus]|uniref:phosphoadenosine phosphosulfate reductase family protein n=1 Tax=Paucidesulfovibrio longus TaxID=889 RepID=UPI0003B5A28D|nr:phosphoadenosine phosphosulfate reductase family protein [Paucidesulfovibrio longus]
MTSARPLSEKIDAALNLLNGLCRAHGPQRVAVAWTGGKDSTVALDLWRRTLAGCGAGAAARVLSVDTGLKFPEVVAFRDRWAREWKLDLTVARPEMELRGYAVAVDKVACCRDLKVLPLQRVVREQGLAVLISGLRSDEHPSRAARAALEPREAGQGCVYAQCNPLLDWSEMEIWAYLTGRNLPFCELYAQGYRSLGCVPCTSRSGRGERSGRAADKEAQLDTLRSLGYF